MLPIYVCIHLLWFFYVYSFKQIFLYRFVYLHISLFVLLLYLLGLAALSLTQADESLDTREKSDLTLKCRFTEQYDAEDFTFYWARWTANPAQFENVAIGDVQLNSGYR